jgi:hypothetical protein
VSSEHEDTGFPFMGLSGEILEKILEHCLQSDLHQKPTEIVGLGRCRLVPHRKPPVHRPRIPLVSRGWLCLVLVVPSPVRPGPGDGAPGPSARVAQELYLPKSWTDDRDRCREVGVPHDVAVATNQAVRGDARTFRDDILAGYAP